MLKIVCMGKLKEEFYREAEKEYKKRIERFIKIDIEEVKKIVYKKCDYKILLDENGNEMKSREFSDFISNLIMKNKKICFIIGGWKGFDENEKEEADFILSLSKMTFPYQLCRIILLEQIYRAITLMKGMPYHK
ncbi:MAG TPA: 23S rRNA (pseudouridine(1915)-N(3))-methyltransferase RlmH [Thermoplasmatales archaeon]|nr:23S rRNA (pseudouridine(1915)-N(3))-methyltransferase RlmH [Thermoplasmatales archaeon]